MSSADSLQPRIQRSRPNPFSEFVTIQVTIPTSEHESRVEVFDLTGQLVRVLIADHSGGGEYDTYWDGRDRNVVSVLPGIYVVVVSADDRVVDMVKVIKYPIP